MQKVFAIAGKDLRSYFSSPIAWVLAIIFALIIGWVFSHDLLNYQQYTIQYLQNKQLQAFTQNQISQPPNVHWVFGGMIIFIGVLFLFFMPLITMRLFAEEKKMGTLELLLSNPVRLSELVLGKFLASLSLLAIFILISSTLTLILWLVAEPRPAIAPFFVGYLGLFLLGGAFLSLGLFISSCTSNQIVAASISFGVAFLLFMLHSLSLQSGGFWQPILSYVSVIGHVDSFTNGIVETKDIFYYLSTIFLGLFLALRSLQSQTWRS